MALTSTILGSAVPGNLRRSRIVATGDNSYPTGGWLVTPALFGFQYLGHFIGTSFSAPPGAAASDFTVNEATNKLQLMTSAGVEITAGTNCTGVTINLEGYGS